MPRKGPAKAKSTAPQRPKPLKAAVQPEKVGKGSPPVHSRFQKGVSGNRKGRPKGSKNLSTIIMAAAEARVTATINGKPRKISNLTAAAMQLATKAAKGDQASMGKFLDWIDEIEARAAAAKPAQFPFTAGDLEVMKAIYERMLLCTPDGAVE